MTQQPLNSPIRIVQHLHTCLHTYTFVYNNIVTKLLQIVETQCSDRTLHALVAGSACFKYEKWSHVTNKQLYIHAYIHTYIIRVYTNILLFIKRDCKWRTQKNKMDAGEHTNIRMAIIVVMILHKKKRKEKCKENFLRDRNRNIWTFQM
jgi:hypothetical protein